MGFIGMCRFEGYGLLWGRVYKSESFKWYPIVDLKRSTIGYHFPGNWSVGWEFSLVKGSKIHLHEHWYRLWVPGYQLHIPTQEFQKNPPGIFQTGWRGLPLWERELYTLVKRSENHKNLRTRLHENKADVAILQNNSAWQTGPHRIM